MTMALNTEKKFWIITLFFLGLFAYGIYNVFIPDRFPMSFVRGEARKIGANVIIGPYPTESELIKLKDNGVEEVISLMDPASPVESELVKREKGLVKRLGLEFKNFPMSFVRLESEENKKRLSSLVSYILSDSTKQRYIHCYLGRHRVGLLEKELEKVLPEEAQNNG